MDGSRFGFSKARSFAPVIPGTEYPRAEACKSAGKCANLIREKSCPAQRCQTCKAAYAALSAKRAYVGTKRRRAAKKGL